MGADKILITGGSGMLGTTLKKYFPKAQYTDTNHTDLRDRISSHLLIKRIRPDIVIHTAAKVGGVLDNTTYPVEYFEDNCSINNNIIHACKELKVPRLIAISSACVYPPNLSKYDEMSEFQRYDDRPDKANFGYGMAKRQMQVYIDLCKRHLDLNYQYLIPCNLYGENDRFDEKSGHFIASMISKVERSGGKEITLFGDGTPIRQFMLVDDLARVIKIIIDKKIYESFNVCPSEEYTVDYVSQLIAHEFKFKGNIKYDSSKPNGQARKVMSNDKMKRLIPRFRFTKLQKGLQKIKRSRLETIEQFL